MPCKTVTIRGPTITGDVTVSAPSLEPSENQVRIRYTVTNGKNVSDSATVVVKLDGKEVDKRTFNLQAGESETNTITARGFNIPEGSGRNVEICTELV